MPTVAEQLRALQSQAFGSGSGVSYVPQNMPSMADAMPQQQRSVDSIQPVSFDDSSASQLNKITATSSPLIQQARQAGMAVANKRGLLNSSIAAGASEAEAYKAAVPLAMQDAQTNLQKNVQNTDVAAQMQRLQVSSDAEMSRLGLQLSNANEQQTTDIQAQMTRLRETNASEMARLQTQLEGSSGQQRIEIAAQMQRLVVSGEQEMSRMGAAAGFDQQRIVLQSTMDQAASAKGAEQQRALVSLQGEISSYLQAQQDQGAFQRLGAQFAHDLTVQDKQSLARLSEIAASGDQEIRATIVKAQEARQDLAMQIAAGDRERVTNSAIQIFQAESNIRAYLLNNSTMPAAERAAYERAISTLGDPVRAFVNNLYSSGAPAPGGATSGAGTAVIAPPPAGSPYYPPATGGGLLNPAPIYSQPVAQPVTQAPAWMAADQGAQVQILPDGTTLQGGGLIAPPVDPALYNNFIASRANMLQNGPVAAIAGGTKVSDIYNPRSL